MIADQRLVHRGAPIQTAVPLESVVLGKVDLRQADLDVLIRKVFGHRVVAQVVLAVEALVAEALGRTRRGPT